MFPLPWDTAYSDKVVHESISYFYSISTNVGGVRTWNWHDNIWVTFMGVRLP